MLEIRQVDGGYIVNYHGEKIFHSFESLVQWLARHFNETVLGVEWRSHVK